MKISYVREDKPLGTIAPLRLVKNLEQNFMVMNGDVLTDINFNKFREYHQKHKGIATIATYEKKVKIDLGVIKLRNKKIVNFKEKPEYRYIVSMGIYIFNKKVLKYVPEKNYLSLMI